jgi:hypothetical protein
MPFDGKAGAQLVLVAVTLAVYAPSLGHGFVWDDHEQVVDNQRLRSWSSFPDFWREDVLALSRPGEGRSNYYRPPFYGQYLAGAQPILLPRRTTTLKRNMCYIAGQWKLPVSSQKRGPPCWLEPQFAPSWEQSSPLWRLWYRRSPQLISPSPAPEP